MTRRSHPKSSFARLLYWGLMDYIRREHNRARARRYRSKNVQACRDSFKAWREKNLGWNKERQKIWYDSHSGKRTEHRKRWAKKHPETARACHNNKENRRRARKYGSRKFTIETNKIYKWAQELRQWFDVAVDHIIPLAKGGSHTPDNLQIIYRLENMRKGARLDYTPSVVFS